MYKISLSIILITVTAFYCASAITAELSGQYEIIAVMPTTNGMAIQLSPNPPLCTSSWWGTQAVISMNVGNYNTLVSNMMAAFMANKKISAIHYNIAGDGSCSNGNELHLIAYKINK